MFTTRTINEVISRFHKGSHFILPLLSITIMISFTTHSYAENKDDKDSNVRKAVINQLLILSGKSKHKEEEPKDAGQDKEVRKRSVEDTIAEQPVNISSNKRIAKSKKEEKKTIKATAVQPLVTFKDKLTNNPNKEKQKSPQPIPNKTPTTSVKIQTVKNKETTPLVEVLSNKEIQTLMLDVMHSSNQEIKPQETSSAQVQVSSPPKVTSREKATDNSDKPEQKNNVATETIAKKTPEKLQSTSKTTTEQKTAKSEPQAIPVGRTQLGRNTEKTAKKILTGWIYLGRFAKSKWESQTLEVEKLPEIGKHYTVKATMVNMRVALPKKGVMSKAIKAIKKKAQVKVIQLRSLGRNREHYWAKIER